MKTPLKFIIIISITSLLGSTFGIQHSLVEMAHIQFYVISGISGYDLLPEFSKTP